MTNAIQFQLGSVSTGTMRPDDLLPAFEIAFAKITGSEYVYIADEYPNPERDRADISDIMGALRELCPPFVYFGAHPGDSADFGFWPDHEAIAEAILDIPVNDADGDWEDFILDETIVTLHDSRYVTVMGLDRRVLWTTI